MDDLTPIHRVIRTLVIDDHPIFRAGVIARLLAKNDAIEIVDRVFAAPHRLYLPEVNPHV